LEAVPQDEANRSRRKAHSDKKIPLASEMAGVRGALSSRTCAIFIATLLESPALRSPEKPAGTVALVLPSGGSLLLDSADGLSCA